MTRYRFAPPMPFSRAPLAGLRVAMLVANSGTGDARVVRQTTTLVEAGCDITVFCLASPVLAAEEQISGVCYVRLRAWHWQQPIIAPFLQHERYAAVFCRSVTAA